MKKTILIGMAIAIIALAFIACGDNNTETHTHDYAAAWSTDATQHWHECTANDGAKTDIAPHQWQWVETAPATTQAPGLETETCATCGATSGNTRPIAQLEPEKAQHSPNTPMFADKTATFTTNDTFTDTQWNAIVTAIVGKFSAAYNTMSAGAKSVAEGIFDEGVTIIVEKNPSGYINYKVTGHTLNVSVAGVDNLNILTILSAISANNTNIDGVTQQPQPCTCNPAEHYLPCDCTGTDCTCAVIPRGYVTATAEWGNTNFPIYQSVGVENEQAITATQTIKDAYDGLGGTDKIALAGANVEIWIVPSTELILPSKDESGKIIMRVRVNHNESQTKSNFKYNIIPLLTP